MAEDNLQKLNNYFKKYIDEMLIKDIELLKARNDELKFSYPYILLVCSCIDLFGGIEKDFVGPRGQGNSLERFTWFVTKWMGEINPLYKEMSLAYLIYESWRCGVTHQATLKKGFETSSYMYSKDKHLHYIEDKDNIYVHSLQFADDFIEAQKKYRKHINGNATDITYIELLFKHLLNMINEYKDKKKENFDAFIKILKDNNLVFKSLAINHAADTTTQLPEEDISSTVSAAPEEDNLK